MKTTKQTRQAFIKCGGKDLISKDKTTQGLALMFLSMLVKDFEELEAKCEKYKKALEEIYKQALHDKFNNDEWTDDHSQKYIKIVWDVGLKRKQND